MTFLHLDANALGMVNLGIKRKEMYGGDVAKPSKDYDSEIVYPEVSVSGKLAEKMGAADLTEGESVEVPVVLKIKRHAKTTEGGKTEYSMTLCIVKMGDMEVVEKDVDDDFENEELPPPGALAALSSPREGWDE